MNSTRARSRATISTIVFLTLAWTGALAQSTSDANPSENELASMHSRIEATITDVRKTEVLIEGAEGDVRTMLERRLNDKLVQIVEDINALSAMIVEQEAVGNDQVEMRGVVADYLNRLMPGLQQQIGEQQQRVVSLLSADTLEDLRAAMSNEISTNKALTTLVDWYSAYYRSIDSIATFGMDATEHREYLATNLVELAEMMVDGINLTSEKIEDTQFQLTLMPDDKNLGTQLKLIELRRDGLVSNLGTVADLLDKLEIDSDRYTSLVVRVSGDVSTEILETGVWTRLLQRWGENAWEWVSDNSLDLLVKLIVLVIILYVARALSRITRRIVEQAIDKVNLSMLLRRMIVATAANGVLVIGILIALSQLGISIGPLLAGLGIAGIIIGFALQDTLSNFASGMMILIYRPYDVGDLIDAGGQFGTVTDMNLVSTVILTIDNQKLVVPNNLVWGGVIRNVTAERTRRVDMTFGISYDDDIPKAERVLREIVTAHEKVLDDPVPDVKLHTLGESSVDFVVRPWVRTEDYWNVYWDITREVKLRFDTEGISIPFPQRDVHLHAADSPSAPAVP